MSKKHHATKSTSSEPKSRMRGKAHRRNLTALWVGLGVLLVAVAAFAFLRPSPPTLPSEMSAPQAHERYQAGAFFLDVRTQDEWNAGHIAKSTLIPLDELPNRLAELPRDKDIVVVCRSGARSKEGATILRQAGFTRVTCMSGGLQAWVAAGYPLEQ